MRTQSRRRLGWAVAGGLAFVVGAPAISRAQQSGIFPLAPIKRERVPCPNEDPVYKLYRHQYFGYHPTCWRKFPSGWGCPSPEGPDPAASFREFPREKPPVEPGDDGQPGPDTQPKPGGDDMTPDRPRNPQPPGNLPPIPSGGRSPFDLDNKPATPPGDDPGAARAPADPAAPAGPNVGVQETPPVADPAPPLSAPASSTSPSPDESASRPDPRGEAPALAVPDPTVEGTRLTMPSAANVSPLSNASTSPFPSQAPKRQSLLSGLFSGLRRR